MYTPGCIQTSAPERTDHEDVVPLRQILTAMQRHGAFGMCDDRGIERHQLVPFPDSNR
ncbi:hypothetical protein D3C86_2236080 [compost metagenome]